VTSGKLETGKLSTAVLSAKRVDFPTTGTGRGYLLINFNALRYFTKQAKATGRENIDRERPRSDLLARAPVNSLTRITPENNGKIRPQPDLENAFTGASGGDEGIRTLETLSGLRP
jgi:hypothetical protein